VLQSKHTNRSQIATPLPEGEQNCTFLMYRQVQKNSADILPIIKHTIIRMTAENKTSSSW